jgi:hypothetical protein
MDRIGPRSGGMAHRQQQDPADVIDEAQSSLREMSIADGLHIKREDVG